ESAKFLKGGQVKTTRVLRGGSWNNNPGNTRAANRNRNNPDNRNNNNGFRCAITLKVSWSELQNPRILRAYL
ncbi:MAG: SUMF1/EgtB/PvdO family nonheme iron enzyme, partial [Deltaproteobacteria bacterium]|nr:SUMF1/EgtB/PvdO family nonheme iron enzyme [Deltaproteobacteria bacterium]